MFFFIFKRIWRRKIRNFGYGESIKEMAGVFLGRVDFYAFESATAARKRPPTAAELWQRSVYSYSYSYGYSLSLSLFRLVRRPLCSIQ